MDTHFRNRAFRKALLGLLACLGLQAVDTSRVGATCGDWLAHPANQLTTAADNTPGNKDKPKTTLAAEVEKTSRRPPLSGHCRGPYCRQAPLRPLPTAPAFVTAPVERLAVFGRSDAPPDVRRQFLVSSESAVRPARGYPQRIDHPPRASRRLS
jgi:hypothetical protein